MIMIITHTMIMIITHTMQVHQPHLNENLTMPLAPQVAAQEFIDNGMNSEQYPSFTLTFNQQS